ncbi:MAG: protein phosphatase 2C domain-containing protein [Candidatus Lernaella stagnicola]|nr:protein phosphatase 2C domain-containing protein [Candidatus Lernaella stagnicola]
MGLYDREPIAVTSATASIPGAGGAGKSQDAVGSLITDRGYMFVVADGHDAGGLGGRAAKLAVETILDTFRHWDGRGARKMLVNAIGMANAALRNAQQRDARLEEIGVSTTLMHYHEGALRIAHVGKCRAYRQRNYVIDQLTEEHVSHMGDYPGGHRSQQTVVVLDRGVGLQDMVEVDVSDALVAQPGETYLLCTDGLPTNVSDMEIGRYCLAGDPAKVCDALLNLAAEQGSKASVSIAMISFSTAPPRTAAPDEGNPIGPSSMRLGPDTPAAGFSFRDLSPWWKLRIFALGVLVVWFVLLVVAWVGFERDEVSMLWPLLLGLVFSTAPIIMMIRWRRGRKGRRRI